MNEPMLKSLKQGMKNTNGWYKQQCWRRGYINEAIEVLENRETLLDETDCYDHLFE